MTVRNPEASTDAALAEAGRPRHHIPTANGTWRYSVGDDGRERGVYCQHRTSGGETYWERVALLPYVLERLTIRDGDGRRTNVALRLSTTPEGTPDTTAIVSVGDLPSGDWAARLDTPLPADRRIRDAAATAVGLAAYLPGVTARESVPRWRGGTLHMPPADVGPPGYLRHAEDEDRARRAWAELGQIATAAPKIALAMGTALGGLYLAALPGDRQPFIVQMTGAARQGKTTALSAAAAVLGYAGAGVGDDGIVRPWNTSPNGLLQYMSTLGCYPAVMDELGAAELGPQRREGLIMKLTQGAQRTIGSKTQIPSRTAAWKGVVISTGNVGITSGVANEGAYGRVVEIPTPITTDAAMAERVPALLPVAYGWPLQWLIRSGWDLDGMAAAVARAEAALPLPAEGVPRTLGRHLALAVAGAARLSGLIGTDVATPAAEAARELLENLTTELNERGTTPGQRLYSAVEQAVATRPRAFPTKDVYLTGESPVPADGIHLGDAVAVFAQRLPFLAQEAGIEDITPGLRDLKLSGHLVTEAGRRRTKLRLGKRGRPDVYQFRLEGDPEEDGPGVAPVGAGGGPGGGPGSPTQPGPPQKPGMTSENSPWPGGGGPGGPGCVKAPPGEQGPPTGTTHDTTQLTWENTEPAANGPTGATPGTGAGAAQPGPPAAPTGATPGPDRGHPSRTAKTPLRHSHDAQEATMVRTPSTGRTGATPGPDRGHRPGPPTGAGPVLAIGLTAEGAYLATAEGITAADPAAEGATADMGALLEWVSRTMPQGGTLALDGDAPDALGWPEVPADSGDYADEYGPDYTPPAVAAARASGWRASDSGIRAWTTWTPEQRGRASITTVCLPWATRRVQGGGSHLMLDGIEDAAEAAALLAMWRHRMGSTYAYNSGSSAVMSLYREFRAPDGSSIRRKRRAPLFRMGGAAAEAAAELSEGNMTWANPAAESLPADTPLVKLDASKQHLSTLSSAVFAVDGLAFRERHRIDKAIPGLTDIPNGDYRLPGGPYLAGPTPPPPGADTIRVPMETAAFLLELDLLADAEYPAWVPVDKNGETTRGVKLFDGVAERIKTGFINDIPSGTADPEAARLLAAGKAAYSEAAGMLRRTLPHVARPDWGHTIIALSRANLLRKVIEYWRATGVWPLLIDADAVVYPVPEVSTDPDTVRGWFTTDRRTGKPADAATAEADRRAVFPVTGDGTKLGGYTVEWSGTLADWRALKGRR